MSERPLVTVIIPMRNEADWLGRCLETVFAQDYPADRIEIIVVDGMSDDGSYEFAVDLASRRSDLKVLRNPARIVPSSLNLAIDEARGDIIARVDSHTMLEPDYISCGVEILERSGADSVGGPMVKIGGGPVGDAIAVAMSSRFGVGSYFQYASEEREADTVYMGMWPRSLFARVGLFDEELVRNQDDEFSYRIRKAGGRIVCSPAMRSLYQNRQSWIKLIRQFFEYGLWKTRVLQKHPAQMSLRHFIPPAFGALVGLGIVSAPLSVVGPVAAVSAAAVYSVIMLGVAWWEGRGEVSVLRVWLALAIIHHAWSIGFLLGAIRFVPRWFSGDSPVRRPLWAS